MEKCTCPTGKILIILEKDDLPQFGTSANNKWWSPTAVNESSDFSLVTL